MFLKSFFRRCVSAAALTSMLTFAVSGVCGAASIEWDGYTAENVNKYSLIQLDNYAKLADTKYQKGGTPVTEHKYDGQYSVHWTPDTSTSVVFYDVLRDWSDYDVLELRFYAENTKNSQFYIEVVCDQPATETNYSYKGYTVTAQEGLNCLTIPLANFTTTRGAEFSKTQRLGFHANGWGIVTNYETEYWISSVCLKKPDKRLGSLETIYTEAEIANVKSAMENAVSIYAGSPNVVADGEVKKLSETSLKAAKKDGVVYAPAEFFKTYLKADVTSDKITVSDKSVNISDVLSYTDGDVTYLDAAAVAEGLGKYVVKNGKLIVMGDSSALDIFKDNAAVNVNAEILAYMTAYVYIEPSELTAEDIKAVKDNWRYELVGDETNDTENEKLKTKYASIEYGCQSALDMLDKTSKLSPFIGKVPDVTGEMTDEYEYLTKLVYGWGTCGNKFYHNEELLDDIRYALSFLYENRYGENEVNGTGWRTPTSAGDITNNWWDWKIGTPRELVKILIVLENELTEEEIENYLYCFDSITESPGEQGNGSNKFNMAQIMFGSAVLKGDVERAVEMRNAIDDTMLYSDNGRGDGMGFFTDGTYVYHAKHMMNGLYGVEHLEFASTFAAIVANTRFEFTNPSADNIYDWIINGYLPLAYNGSLMNIASGRYPANPTAPSIMSSMLKETEFVSEENELYLKSLIKQQYEADVNTQYYQCLAFSDCLRLTEILNDESIPAAGTHTGGHVYAMGDRVTNQREKYSAGVAMSSSRIYNYESISGANTKGWYMGDGMLLVYNENEQRPYGDSYWKNANPYKLPGTTVDSQEREAASIGIYNAYLSSQDFVGGVTDGTDTIAAMALESYHSDKAIGDTDPNPAHSCSLTANKAYFMFDGEIVCLGSAVNANDGYDVYTTVENRKANKTVSLIDEASVTESYSIIGVTASQIPEEENVPENTLDGDFNTKWAASGEASIIWELEKNSEMGFAGLSFMNGSTRQQIFDLEVSADGASWTQVFSGMSGGKTENVEYFDLKNTAGKYLKLVSHGATTSDWLSLTTVTIYPPNADGTMTVISPELVGGEKITTDTGMTVGTSETSLEGVKWVHLENTGGYFFPNGGNIKAKRTTGASSFFEMWLDHGVSPQNEAYSYVILPSKSAEVTAAYAQNPDIEIISNTAEVQAVREKSSGTLGIVFWKAGSVAGITADKPMLVLLKERDGRLDISVSDPTQKLEAARLTIKGSYSLSGSNDKAEVSQSDSELVLDIDFTDSMGKSITVGLDGAEVFFNSACGDNGISDIISSESALSAESEITCGTSPVSLKIDMSKASDSKVIDLATLTKYGKKTKLEGYSILKLRLLAPEEMLGKNKKASLVISQADASCSFDVAFDWSYSDTEDGWHTYSIKLDSLPDSGAVSESVKSSPIQKISIAVDEENASEGAAIYIDKLWLE